MLTREQAVDFLINRPVRFAHMLGFTKLTDLHGKWINDMVRGRGDMTLMAHRASYKTTCVSLSLALILILLPRKRTLFMRKTDADVKEVIKQVQKILQNPRTVYLAQCIYGIGLTLTTQSATEINTNLVTDSRGTVQLLGIGTGGSLTGKHFDIIFTDDIINVNDRVSKAERERTKVVYQELQNIKNRGGRIINTLTPWHSEDASTLMPEPQKYDCYTTGLITDEELQAIRDSMVPSLFACNYELRFVASEQVIFADPQTGADPANVQQGLMHLDAAFYGEDFTAWGVMKKAGGKYYLYGRMRRTHVEDCYAEIVQDYTRFLCGKLAIEDNADKGFVARDLRALGCRTSRYTETQNKYLKIVTFLKAVWKDLVFVAGTDKAYIQQICDYYEDAEHDDAPDDAASLARLLYHKAESHGEYTPIF